VVDSTRPYFVFKPPSGRLKKGLYDILSSEGRANIIRQTLRATTGKAATAATAKATTTASATSTLRVHGRMMDGRHPLREEGEREREQG